MRSVDVRRIKEAVSELCIRSNIEMRKDILSSLKRAYRVEKKRLPKKILSVLIENAKVAKTDRVALCQDTGVVVVYMEIGQDVHLVGGSLKKMVDLGVQSGYERGFFRDSVVEPLSRKRLSFGKNVPSILYTRLVDGNRIKITVAPKGFGSENKSRLRMFKPTDSLKEISDFIVESAKEAGPEACPPFVIGVGIGGTFDRCAQLSKEALLLPLNRHSLQRDISKLENTLLKRINRLGIGPMGLGGKTTALSVRILTHPTHIAGLPVAVSIGCVATRSASSTL